MSAETTRTVAYIRVSTRQQADHGVSLAAQREKVVAYAKLYDLDIVAVEVDAGVSAKNLNRPGLQSALGMLRDGSAEALLVCKLDRLTRSMADLGHLVDKYFGRGGAELLSVAENVDTRSAAGRLVLNVLGAVSSWERDAISERTREALRHKASKGEYTGGKVPFGYSVSDDGMLQPVAWEQDVLSLVRALRAEGVSLRKIAAKLAELGFSPRKGTKWHPQQIKHMLATRLVEGVATA